MIFSKFGNKFAQNSGISTLMKDLNDGLRTPGAIMLGGGNPAHIPEMDEYFQTLLSEMCANGKLTETLCNYDGPQGKDAMLKALAATLKAKLGWNISAKISRYPMVAKVRFSIYLTCLLVVLKMVSRVRSYFR